MADVTERMLALLSTLQTGRQFSGDELTRRLGVSPRTLRRDIDRLRRYGYPVQTQPGPGGYYRLAAGRTMPPLVLDDDEAVATLLALASLSSVGSSEEGGIDAAATRAYGKLDQFLPARLRPRMASIRSSLETGPQAAPSVITEHLAVLAEAITQQEPVSFTYSNAAGERTERRVDPYRQIHHLLRWYLLAWDLQRDDWRVFRLDRITDVVRVGGLFEARPLPTESALDYLREGFNRGKERVRLQVSAPASAVVEALKFQDADIRPISDHSTEVSLSVDTWQWLVLHLAILDTDVEILAGRQFARDCRTFGHRLIAAAETLAMSPGHQ